MICKRCNTTLTKIKDNEVGKKAVKELGIFFSGTYKCLNCYPHKT